MPNFPPDFHAYAHPEKTRHLQMEVTQAPQSQPSTSPFTPSTESEMWNNTTPPLLSLPSLLLAVTKSYQTYLGTALPPAEPTAEVFLQDCRMRQSPNRSLRCQSQPSPHPFSNYRIFKEMQIFYSSQFKTFASRLKIWVLATMAVTSNWPWTSHFSQILIFYKAEVWSTVVVFKLRNHLQRGWKPNELRHSPDFTRAPPLPLVSFKVLSLGQKAFFKKKNHLTRLL